jgi:hypothetical protein
VQRDDGRSLLKGCELGFNLQSLGFEFGDAPTSIILSNDLPDDQVNRFCDLDIGLIDRAACSPGSLHLVRGSATRANSPLNPNCRGSCRSKMSTIIPVEQATAYVRPMVASFLRPVA